jgi:tyrosine-protein kinase Etk/Wzc
VVHWDRGSAITEEYRSLRTSLLAQRPDGRFCYLVTSADPGEGKTVTCANLGLILTERVDHQTLVLDSDLRRGKLARVLAGRREPGLADLLRGRAALRECVHRTAYPNLSFLPSGRAAQDEVGELLGRPELEEVVNRVRRQYDHVILDTPPINVASDAGIIGRSVGEALLVVRMNKTRQESVDKAARLLHAANVTLSGIVLTHRKYHIPNYLYRYA